MADEALALLKQLDHIKDHPLRVLEEHEVNLEKLHQGVIPQYLSFIEKTNRNCLDVQTLIILQANTRVVYRVANHEKKKAYTWIRFVLTVDREQSHLRGSLGFSFSVSFWFYIHGGITCSRCWRFFLLNQMFLCLAVFVSSR